MGARIALSCSRTHVRPGAHAQLRPRLQTQQVCSAAAPTVCVSTPGRLAGRSATHLLPELRAHRAPPFIALQACRGRCTLPLVVVAEELRRHLRLCLTVHLKSARPCNAAGKVRSEPRPRARMAGSDHSIRTVVEYDGEHLARRKRHGARDSLRTADRLKVHWMRSAGVYEQQWSSLQARHPPWHISFPLLIRYLSKPQRGADIGDAKRPHLHEAVTQI